MESVVGFTMACDCYGRKILPNVEKPWNEHRKTQPTPEYFNPILHKRVPLPKKQTEKNGLF